MKATKKNIKAVAKAFLNNRNLTEFCKNMKAMGIVKKWGIVDACENVLGKKDYRRIFTLIDSVECHQDGTYRKCLNRDLDDHTQQDMKSGYMPSLVEKMKENKIAGNYKKILFEGNKHIYWCSPEFGHRDYNKSVWRDNTPENRKKMQIINNFLNK